MDTNLYTVKELLQKYRKGILSPSESKDLLSLLEKSDLNSELSKEIEEEWYRIRDIEYPYQAGQMWPRLKNEIFKDYNSKKPGLSGAFKTFLKYAAVILLTMCFTWVAKDLLQPEASGKITDNFTGASNEVFVPYGSKSRIVLSDGSEVILNSGSYMRYPAIYDNSSREAFIQGEAFFNITKDTEKPFIVHTPEITIKVLGTKFNVKSYINEKTVETTLVSGSIEIYRNGESTPGEKSQALLLKPNQQAILEKETGSISVTNKTESAGNNVIKPVKPFLVQKKADLDPVIGWKDNRLVFRDESFYDLSKRLERWYNVEIEIQNKALAGALFSGIFEKETIEQALNALRIATPYEYKMNKNKITIY